MEETDPDALLIGEVWEDASNKISYSQRRKYLLGHELHGVMNYPFRTALLAYLLGGDAAAFREAMETIRENYPPAAFYAAMNFLGTHDTPRILTILGGGTLSDDREWQSTYRLSPEQRALGLARVRLAAAVLFTFPGSPMVYYGDEAGMEGCGDPFNRGTFPWGQEDLELQGWFRKLGTLRKERPSLQRGSIRWKESEGPLLVFTRNLSGERTITVVNAGPEGRSVRLEEDITDLISGEVFPNGEIWLEPYRARVLGQERECFT